MVRDQPRRTKIVATIGPATGTAEGVRALVESGMDAARLNLSHGTREEHAERARLIRDVQETIGRPLALIAEVLQPGHEVLIDDGLVRLRVERIRSGRAECAVLAGGIVSAHKGVNLPGVPVPIPSLTRKDMDDLEFAMALDVDFVALSFVRAAADVRDLKDLIKQAGSTANVIAKIEKAEAVDALDAILQDADAVMVARGDLGVEIGPELVPLLQKRIIIGALDHGKPVITATQMLESMIHQPEPTRAEASDVANAILDGTSALMLSGETAI